MNRRKILKAALAAPIVVALPPLEPNGDQFRGLIPNNPAARGHNTATLKWFVLKNIQVPDGWGGVVFPQAYGDTVYYFAAESVEIIDLDLPFDLSDWTLFGDN